MSRSRTSQSSVSNFLEKVNEFISRLNSNEQELKSIIPGVIEEIKRSIYECKNEEIYTNQTISYAKEVLSRLKNEETRLKQKLQNTPKTIDTEEGSQTNPEYLQLQRELEYIQAKIRRVESLDRDLQIIKKNIKKQIEFLNQCNSNVNAINESIAQTYKLLNEENNIVVNKLNKILKTIEDYLSVKI